MTLFRKSRILAGLLALLGGAGAADAAGPISPEDAPRDWVVYAENATREVTAWLNAEQPPAPRIRAVLEATRPAPDQPTPPLVVKLWIGRDGAISQVDFPPLSEAGATEDLRGLLLSHRLAAPPRRMRLPIRLALRLAPRPPSPEPQSSAPGQRRT